MKKIFLFLFMLFSCSSKEDNQTTLNFPELLSLINDSNTAQYLAYFYVREVDQSLTSNCGVATPATTATAQPGVPGQTPTPTTDPNQSTSTRFNILSQLVMKNTGETLTMKFLYDTSQFQGALDQQQGFTLTGGVFNSTVTGKQGTVRWSGQGAGYIDEATKTQQVLTFLEVDVSFRGTFSTSSTTTTAPVECYTTDGIKCTSTITTTKCFTQDNINCVSSSTATGTVVNVTGKVKCTSKNVIQ